MRLITSKQSVVLTVKTVVTTQTIDYGVISIILQFH